MDLVIFTIPDGESYKTLQTWSNFRFSASVKTGKIQRNYCFWWGLLEISRFCCCHVSQRCTIYSGPNYLISYGRFQRREKLPLIIVENLIGAFHHPRLVLQIPLSLYYRIGSFYAGTLSCLNMVLLVDGTCSAFFTNHVQYSGEMLHRCVKDSENIAIKRR